MSDRCITCGCKMPPLNGCEEDDFAAECEWCREHGEESDDE
jgi:hypothetical protein